MPSFGAAKQKKEKRLRKALLDVLFLFRTSPSGGVSGRLLADTAEGLLPNQGFEDDDHALLLIRDLTAAGLAKEKPLGERRRGQRFGIDWIELSITDAGCLLHEQKSPAHPLVDDDRQVEE